MVGSAWQRCRVHFMRNVLARVKRNNTHMVIAAIQTIFAQPDAASVREQFDRIVATLEGQFPDVATMLDRRQGGPPGLCGLSRGPLAEGLVLQPLGAAPPGDQAAHATWSGCSPTTSRRTPGHRRGGRDPRRVAGGRAPLPVGDLDGPAPPHGGGGPRRGPRKQAAWPAEVVSLLGWPPSSPSSTSRRSGGGAATGCPPSSPTRSASRSPPGARASPSTSVVPIWKGRARRVDEDGHRPDPLPG